MKPFAQRMNPLKEIFFAGMEKRIKSIQESGHEVIRLDIGSPDLPPPPPVLEALTRSAVLPNSHGYQPYSPEVLRHAWAALYHRLHDVDLDPENEVLPLLGSKEGIFHLTQALVDPGDVVLVPDPGYMIYSRAALFAGGEPVMLPLLPERRYLPDLEAIPTDKLRRAKILWLNYPNNPTTSTADLAFFSKAVDFARQYDLVVCHDAAYTQVTFDGYRAPSLLEAAGAKDVAVEFNTLSKSHNMAGWRVGVMVGNKELVRALSHLKANVDSSHFLPIIRASAEALNGDQTWIVERNAIYRRRRDAALSALKKFGCHLPVPVGSLYLWCPIPHGLSSVDFAQAALEEAHVSLTPGTVFGEQGEGYFRASLIAPHEKIETAFERIGKMLQIRERRPE
jgi:LL-diaminopimelate aminotransferase